MSRVMAGNRTFGASLPPFADKRRVMFSSWTPAQAMQAALAAVAKDNKALTEGARDALVRVFETLHSFQDWGMRFSVLCMSSMTFTRF